MVQLTHFRGIVPNMKIISYNILPICFLILAGFLAYIGKDGYGWCIFLSVINTIFWSNKEESK